MEDEIKQNKKITVSFSQFQTYNKCPKKFYIDYPLGKRAFDDNINTCFGTSMHNTLQLYIKTLYTESSVVADSLDLINLFKNNFKKELIDKKVLYSDDDYTDFVFDGEDILESFCNSTNRLKQFPSHEYEFIGIEMSIKLPVRQNLEFSAYIDLVLKNKKTGKYRIIDFKTSTMGWRSSDKEDKIKCSQLLLYKALYSKLYNVPLNDIDVEFFILKRKLYEKVNFPQSRIQKFIPKQNDKEITNTLNNFTKFITTCFTENGEYKTDEYLYPKNPGENKKNCKWCGHYKILCDGKEENDINNDA